MYVTSLLWSVKKFLFIYVCRLLFSCNSIFLGNGLPKRQICDRNFNFLLLKGLKGTWVLVYNDIYQLVWAIPSRYLHCLSNYSHSVLNLNSLITNSYQKTYISLFNQVISSFYKWLTIKKTLKRYRPST